MAIIHLVRHGKAAAGFGGHLDPGLDDTGREQAKAAAAALAPLGPLPIYSSPLARARETAAPLAECWGVVPVIEPRVAEIPSPTADLRERARWLRGVMQRTWAELEGEPALIEWRDAMLACARAWREDCVTFCHFIAINVIVGAAVNADALISFQPDNASITKVRCVGGELTLLERGRAAATHVN